VAKKKSSEKNAEWLEFEQLVTRIERTLATEAVVKHNDRVWDRDAEGWRQVDVTIRGRMGSSPIFITVECRKRGRKSDVRWIEELAEKREGIGADKTIAVASKPISKPALRKAKAKRIEVRLISEITPEEIRSWCELTVIHHGYTSVSPVQILFEFEEGYEDAKIHESVVKLLAKKGLDAPILLGKGFKITPRNIVDSWQREHHGTELDFGYNIQFDGQSYPVGRRAPVEPKTYRIKTNRGIIYIRGVQIYAMVTSTLTEIPLSTPFQYSGEGAPVVHGVEATTSLGPKITFSLIKTDDGQFKLSITPEQAEK
jgi:hypothetical protein